MAHHIETVKDYDLKCINNKKGRTISDPAFLRIRSLSVLLLIKFSSDSSHSSQSKAEEKDGGWFGDL